MKVLKPQVWSTVAKNYNNKDMSLVYLLFNAVKLQVVTIRHGKEWCRAKEVCKALEYKKDTAKMS